MNYKNYSILTSVIFLAIAVLHALRLIYGSQAVVAGWVVPMWISLVAVVLGLYLSYWGIKFGKRD